MENEDEEQTQNQQGEEEEETGEDVIEIEESEEQGDGEVEEVNDDDEPIVILEEVPVAAMEENQKPAAEEIDSEAFAPASGTASVGGAVATIRPTPREDRFPSFGRNTLAFEDGGDDGWFITFLCFRSIIITYIVFNLGIVSSTPVLLRPRTNEGFAEAASSLRINTRFVFGSQPELSPPAWVVPTNISGSNTMESREMEDTRMDLTQLEEKSVRNMPEEVSSSSVILAEDLPAARLPEKQPDFEGGPDRINNNNTCPIYNQK